MVDRFVLRSTEDYWQEDPVANRFYQFVNLAIVLDGFHVARYHYEHEIRSRYNYIVEQVETYVRLRFCYYPPLDFYSLGDGNISSALYLVSEVIKIREGFRLKIVMHFEKDTFNAREVGNS